MTLHPCHFGRRPRPLGRARASSVARLTLFFVREAPRHDAALREVARRVVGAFYIYHDVPEEDRAARQGPKAFSEGALLLEADINTSQGRAARGRKRRRREPIWEPLLPFRDGESKRAGRPSSRDGARDVCSKRLRAPADAADPESTDRPSGLGGERTGDGGGLFWRDESTVRYESTDGWTSNCPKASSWTSTSTTVPKFGRRGSSHRRRPVPKEAAREALYLQRARADGGRGGLRQLDRERWWDDREGGVGGGGGRGHVVWRW